MNTNNPPAFPKPGVIGLGEQEGMTLRDYFAAKAMQAMVQKIPYHVESIDWDYYTDKAFRCADAMLKAREQ